MLPRFELYMPETLEEACRLKAKGALPVAGGTDVYVNMHGGKERPAALVDIKGVKELDGVSFSLEKGFEIGALTSHRRIEEWDKIKRYHYALFQGCSQVGSVQIRYRGTVGGNIMNGAPSADSCGPLLACGAEVVVAGPKGERVIPFEKFYTGFKKHDIAEDELLKRILLPVPPENSGTAYYKYTRRGAMDLALLGVSAYLELTEGRVDIARIALTTAATTPVRSYNAESVLAGNKLTDELIIKAAEAVAAEGKPRSSWRSSAEFRVRLLHDLTVTVLHEAAERAGKSFDEKSEPIPAKFYEGQLGLKSAGKEEHECKQSR